MVRGWARAVRRQAGYEAAAVRRSTSRALRHSGPERATAVQALKAAGAAMAAWALAAFWIESPMALMAPWTALALVETTVYRSLRAGVQQLAIISTGTLWASAAMYLSGGSTLPAMAVSLPPLMLIAGYSRLGAQGVYGATTALLVIAYGSYEPGQIGHRLLETLIGAIIGLSVNAFVLPPLRLDDVRANLHSLALECADLLHAVAAGLRGPWDAADTDAWEDRASRLHSGVRAVARARWRSAESARLNPGRRLRRGHRTRCPSPDVDRRWQDTVHHLTALTRTLSGIAAGSQPLSAPPGRFASDYADLADSLSHLCAEQAERLAQDEDHHPEAPRQHATDAWVLHEEMPARLHGQVDSAAIAVSGGLLVEMRQLLMALAPEEANTV
ncbi:aromatic acid exporter family protein [Streptomyces sp. NPDC086010]|uniref:aromatic acid exporter family protein n=1 Tax=Streptomyces sp. NPDC086010 TaxID=3365745 RepID=UPI0037D21E74